jgi:flavin-binding protein dodecin
MDRAVADRLRKIVGMFGSSHEGERAAAMNLASALLKQHNLTWADVIAIQGAPQSQEFRAHTGKAKPKPSPRPPVGIDMRDIPTGDMDDDDLIAYAEQFVSEHDDDLYDLGDTSFLVDVAGKDYWSPRQRDGFVRSLRRAWMIRREAGVR